MYVYYQYRQQLSEAELLSSIDRVLDGTYTASGDDTLEKNLGNTLLSDRVQKGSFSKEEAINALKSIRETIDRAVASGHRYLTEMVLQNYRTFLPLLKANYSDLLARNSVFASIHNHFDAEGEIYRAACYVLPGTREYAEGIFNTQYSSPEYSAMMKSAELRSMEFLQWFCTMFVIPSVEMLPPEWYMATFGRLLSDRVRPVFRNVLSQRNSIFTVSRFQKNRATFVDLVSSEVFEVRIPKGFDVPSGPMMELTVVRHATMWDINSMLKLIPESDASEIAQDIRRRREIMSATVKKFSAENGQAVTFGNLASAVSAYDAFVSKADIPESGEMGVPRLLNAEAFGSYPDYRTALLCEENNFYISLHYPLLMDVMGGVMHGKDAVEVVESSFDSHVAIPFTSLKRLFHTDAARLLSALRIAYPNISTIEEMGNFIQRSRGHSFSYSPLPLFSKLRKIADRYVVRD